MQIWVGLGNPGAKYALHRHNVGIMAADIIAEVHGFGPWQKKFRSLIAEGRIGRHKVLLVKPQTFMNDSGDAVQQALHFYKLDEDALTVFHDELDLAPFKVKVQRRRRARRPQRPALDQRLARARLPPRADRHRPSRPGAEGKGHAARARQLPQVRDGGACPTCSPRSRPRPNGSPTATTSAS